MPSQRQCAHGPAVIAMMLGRRDFALGNGSIPSDESLELPKRLSRSPAASARRGDDRHSF